MDQERDHDLLVTVAEQVKHIDKWCTNHTVHHMRYAIMAWSTAAGAIVTLLVLLIKGG